MIVVRAATLTLLTALATACTISPERGYYAPVGVTLGDTIASWNHRDDHVTFDVRLQGIYVNEVAGRDVRTAHVQMEVTRTRSGHLLIPLEGMTMDLVRGTEPRSQELEVAEAWSGTEPVVDTILVPPWSRRSFDVFFDDVDLDSPLPEAARLRWRYRVDGRWSFGDCQFHRIDAEDPRLPGAVPIANTDFGIRDGYYLPGWPDLGPRRLRPSDETRRHYLFHKPGGWMLF